MLSVGLAKFSHISLCLKYIAHVCVAEGFQEQRFRLHNGRTVSGNSVESYCNAFSPDSSLLAWSRGNGFVDVVRLRTISDDPECQKYVRCDKWIACEFGTWQSLILTYRLSTQIHTCNFSAECRIHQVPNSRSAIDRKPHSHSHCMVDSRIVSPR